MPEIRKNPRAFLRFQKVISECNRDVTTVSLARRTGRGGHQIVLVRHEDHIAWIRCRNSQAAHSTLRTEIARLGFKGDVSIVGMSRCENNIVQGEYKFSIGVAGSDRVSAEIWQFDPEGAVGPNLGNSNLRNRNPAPTAKKATIWIVTDHEKVTWQPSTVPYGYFGLHARIDLLEPADQRDTLQFVATIGHFEV